MDRSRREWMVMRDGCGPSGWGSLVVLAFLAIFLTPPLAWAETAILEATADATLIEDADGDLANGVGPVFFVGRNNGFVARRALVAFDVAASLPPGAWITAAWLELEMTPSNPTVIDVGLHRVLTPWSEGPSSASGGGGALAEPGDATWIHTSYDVGFWEEPGGDFDLVPSATTSVGESGLYVWTSTPALVADVWSWLDDPTSNDGWILVGGEDRRQTAKSFASRESPVEMERPRLVVRYETRCDAFDLGPRVLGLCRAYCEALDCAGPEPLGSTRACTALAHGFARRSGSVLPCTRPEVDRLDVSSR